MYSECDSLAYAYVHTYVCTTMVTYIGVSMLLDIVPSDTYTVQDKLYLVQ